MATQSISGIGIGNSSTFGRAFLYVRNTPKVQLVCNADCAHELERFSKVLAHAKKEVTALADSLNLENKHAEEILSAQMEFLDDEEYVGAIREKITTDKINAEAAIDSICTALVQEFMLLENEYFRERASDIEDISTRLIAYLSGVVLRSLGDIEEEVIVVANDLLPSDTARLNPQYVRAFCTEKGTATSHTALLANSLGIPAVVGCGKMDIKNNSRIIVDGARGIVRVDPSDSEIAEEQKKIAAAQEYEQTLIAQAQEAAITADGSHCHVLANIASAREAETALTHGADGSGLLRTEFFFYHEESVPNEERQFEMYAEVARTMQGKSITVRTLDIGGDKPLKGVPDSQIQEDNPFLGVRGIRLTNNNPALFEAQLRALMKVACECDVVIKIMFPFVSTVDEMKVLKATAENIRSKITTAYQDTDVHIQIGAMIEVPSAALVIDHIFNYADFVSIGTNDLAQYVMAADRNNERVSALAGYCDPAVIRLIQEVIRSGERNKKDVSICGEMAGDPLVIPLLYGMGLFTYSMSAVRISHAKKLLSRLDRAECAALATRCLAAESKVAVRALLDEFAKALKGAE